MAGPRNRCFYCSDSRAADVDHFMPISVDFTETFRWANLLWACPECNRRKLARFPVSGGQPLVLNPTQDDPWQYLVLDEDSGVVAARYDGASLDIRGATTLDVLAPLTWEPVQQGRSRSIRRLRRAARDTLRAADPVRAAANLAREVLDGVAEWFALWEGRDSDPFSALRSQAPSVWRRFVVLTYRKRYG